MPSFLLLLLFVVAGTLAVEENCGADQVNTCLSKFLDAVVQDVNDIEGTCREMKEVLQCYQDVAENCDVSQDPDVAKSLQDLENIIQRECTGAKTSDPESVMHNECVEKNSDYIVGCLQDGTLGAMSVMSGLRDMEIDMNVMRCVIYATIAECVTDRIEEKCGEKASKQASAELLDQMPPEIVEACTAAAESPLIEHLYEEKRK